MFSKMNDIDWEKIVQAHGDSREVPLAMQLLVSKDSNEQKEAYWKLDNHVILQGDLYEASYSILPFLFEALESEKEFGRKRIYDLLFEIANGYGEKKIECILTKQHTSIMEACQKYIASKKSFLYQEISDIKSSYRVDAVDLVFSVKAYIEDLLLFFQDLLKNEKDPIVRDKLCEYLGELKK